MSREPTITTEIDDLTHRSHTGLLGFGDYVTHLVALGVESYHVDYLRRASTYHLSSGETHEVSHHHVPAGAVAEAWSADRVHEAVRGAQRGEVLYPQFVALTRAAGCVGYSVWIAGRHVRYFGRRGETLVEPFPAPDAAPDGLRAPVELVRRLYESMLRRDAAAVLERFDPGIVIEQSPEVPWGGHYEGHDGAKAFLARLGGAIRSTPVVERLVDAGEHDAIDAEAYPPGCVPFKRSYHPGTLRYEDQVFPGVGIKIKGGCGSSRDLGGKASFKVDLEWDDESVFGCPAERRLLGETHFTFNNGVQDQSASHERVGYSIFRDAGVPTPRIAHVRLFVNDELWGVYQHVETIDRRFLSRWFESNDGMMYEGTYWCDLTSNNLPPTDDDDSACLTREFSPNPCSTPGPGADPLDYALLRAMIEQVEALPDGGFYPAITGIFDFDAFLTTWAVESVIGHWDNYAFSIMNNYRVYHDPTTGLWTLISTGIDQTFDDELDPWGTSGVLASRCLAEPDCEAAFAARLHEVNDRFESTDLAGRATFVFDQISPHIMEDPRREYGLGTFQARHQDLLDFIAARPDQIRDDLAAHGY